MNRLEASYAKHLDLRKAAGEVIAWWFEALSFRIGHLCKWHPDFLVQLTDGTLELHDTKGFTQDDARVKARAIADKFPFDVYHITRKKGEWVFEKM
jgi:hypothetical protein